MEKSGVIDSKKQFASAGNAEPDIAFSIALLSKREPITVLDVGSGDGQFSIDLIKANPSHDVINFDSSPKMRHAARMNVLRAHQTSQNKIAITFNYLADGLVNACTAHRTVNTIHTQNDLNKYFNNVSRVLTSGGIHLLSIFDLQAVAAETRAKEFNFLDAQDHLYDGIQWQTQSDVSGKKPISVINTFYTSSYLNEIALESRLQADQVWSLPRHDHQGREKTPLLMLSFKKP